MLSVLSLVIFVVAVRDFHPVSCRAQTLAELVRDYHRAVFASGATDSDRQVGFSFHRVVGHEVAQEVVEPIQELAGRGLRQQELLDRGVVSIFLAKLAFESRDKSSNKR